MRCWPLVDPLDVTGAMGVLITAAIFLNGFTAVRWQAYLADAPKRYALLDTEQQGVFRRPPSSWAMAAALALLATNLALFVLGLDRLDDQVAGSERRLTIAVLIAFIVAHGIVAALTVLQVRNAKKDDKKAWSLSAHAAFLQAIGVAASADAVGRLAACRRRLALSALALDRVPPDIPRGPYRSQVRDARVEYAEALVDERRPDAALDQLALAAEQEWSPGFLRSGGAERAADWFDDFRELGLAELRARAHRLRGDVDAEFEAWLHALRTAPPEFRSSTELLDAARRAGRVSELHGTLVALVSGDEEPEWAETLFTLLAQDLTSHRAVLPADLDELRLLVDAGGGAARTLELVRRLLDAAVASEPDDRAALLEEVDGLLGRFAVDGSPDAGLLELQARRLLLGGRPTEAYERLLLEATPRA